MIANSPTGLNGRTHQDLVTASRWTEAATPNGHHGSPELNDLTFGFLPLTDAAPLIIAHAKGWFAEFDIRSKLQRAPSWTALRDALNTGGIHAGQMLFSMPVASACGLLGVKQKPLVVPWVLNRNGQAITLNKMFQGKAGNNAAALRAAAVAGRDAGRPLAFAHTLRVGTHAMWLRYWLAAGGIHPDRDVALITVPPAQMAVNMRLAKMAGFCVGEPWNARTLAEGLGFTAVTSQEIWPDHPEKVFAFTQEFAQQYPRTVVATLKAIYRASVWLDNSANHQEAANILAQPEHLNCDAAWIRARFGSNIDYGDGRPTTTALSITFAQRGANCPQASHAIWFLTQLRRWGLHFGEPDYAGVAAQVIRADLCHQALSELGVTEEMPAAKTVLFDGIEFDPAKPEGYAKGFELKNIIE